MLILRVNPSIPAYMFNEGKARLLARSLFNNDFVLRALLVNLPGCKVLQHGAFDGQLQGAGDATALTFG